MQDNKDRELIKILHDHFRTYIYKNKYAWTDHDQNVIRAIKNCANVLGGYKNIYDKKDKQMKNEIIIDGIKIDVRTSECLYITIGDWTYYIDDSTNEQIMDKWKETK